MIQCALEQEHAKPQATRVKCVTLNCTAVSWLTITAYLKKKSTDTDENSDKVHKRYV